MAVVIEAMIVHHLFHELKEASYIQSTKFARLDCMDSSEKLGNYVGLNLVINISSLILNFVTNDRMPYRELQLYDNSNSFVTLHVQMAFESFKDCDFAGTTNLSCIK